MRKKILITILILTSLTLKISPVRAENPWAHEEDGSSSYGDYQEALNENGELNNTNNNSILSGVPTIVIPSIAIIFILSGIVLIAFKKNKNLEKDIPAQKKEVTDEEIKKLDNNLTKEKLIEEVFNLYKDSEIAKMKGNTTKLKELLTEELYQEYEKYIKELKEQKQKLVATNITQEEVKILSIKKENAVENIEVYLHISQYDYIIDKNKKIIRGTDEFQYQIEYKMILTHEHDKLKIKKKDCIGKWISN